MNSHRAGVAYVLIAALLFSTSGTAQALSDVNSTPIGLGAARLAIGVLVLVAVMPLFGQSRRDVVRLWRDRAVLVAGVCAGFFQWGFFTGVQQAGVALGTLLTIGSAPVLTGVLSWLLFGRRPSRVWVIATIAAIVGLAMLSKAGATHGSLVGVVAALAAGASVAAYMVAVKSVLDRGTHPVVLLTSAGAIAVFVLVPFVVTQPMGWLLDPRGMLLVAYLGIATLAISNTLQLQGIALLGAAPVATLMIAEPVLATVWGIVLLGEQVGVVGAVGLVLVIASLAAESLALTRSPRHAAEIAPMPGEGMAESLD